MGVSLEFVSAHHVSVQSLLIRRNLYNGVAAETSVIWLAAQGQPAQMADSQQQVSSLT